MSKSIFGVTNSFYGVVWEIELHGTAGLIKFTWFKQLKILKCQIIPPLLRLSKINQILKWSEDVAMNCVFN